MVGREGEEETSCCSLPPPPPLHYSLNTPLPLPSSSLQQVPSRGSCQSQFDKTSKYQFEIFDLFLKNRCVSRSLILYNVHAVLQVTQSMPFHIGLCLSFITRIIPVLLKIGLCLSFIARIIHLLKKQGYTRNCQHYTSTCPFIAMIIPFKGQGYSCPLLPALYRPIKDSIIPVHFM